jgi:single-strand DNA-binding protein
MSVNKAILMGNLGKDPEITQFGNGGVVAQFTLATTKKGFKTTDGKEIPERTEWHNIVLSNGLAKVAEKFLKKGDKLYVEGEIRNRSYEDSNGIKRYVTEIYVNNMEMLTPKKEGQKGSTETPPPPMTNNEKDDLPF